MGIFIQVEDAQETEPHRGWIGLDRDVRTSGLTIDAPALEADAGMDIAAGVNPGTGGKRPLRTGRRSFCSRLVTSWSRGALRKAGVRLAIRPHS